MFAKITPLSCFAVVFFIRQQVESQVITKPIISFCTGGSVTCAIFDNKKMKCMGQGSSLGSYTNYGSSPATNGDNVVYVDVGTGMGIDKVYCGGSHICVKLDSGAFKCLGSNDYGQTGQGVSANPLGSSNGYIGNNLPVVQLGTGLQVVDAALGYLYSCVKITGNKIKCFGSNFSGELGLGDTTQRGKSPSQMGDNLPFVNLGAGVEVATLLATPTSYTNCVILSAPVESSQRVKCWGWGQYSQLGYGGSTNAGTTSSQMGDNLLLLDFGIESRVKHMALGFFHTCGLLINNSLKCFGKGTQGQLGYGSLADLQVSASAAPFVLLDSGKTIKLLSTGYYHTCIVYDDMKTMKCVGDNSYGQLGRGDTETRGTSPTSMFPNIPAIDLGIGSLTISSIHAGKDHNCIVLSDSSVKCIGGNDYGQLGIGETGAIGDEQYEMGTNLTFALFFTPTTSPTMSPTMPTNAPTTKSPTTTVPTKAPNTSTPTKSPTKKPSANSLTTTSPTSNTVVNANSNIPFMMLMLASTYFLIFD